MMRLHAPLLALLLACSGLQLALACSDVAMTNTSLYDALISARNYDFFAEKVLTMQFSAMPAHTKLVMTPLLGCESPSGLSAAQLRNEYGFICQTVGRPEFIAGFWLGCGDKDYKDFPGQCTEGFNTQGLSVGALTEQSQPFPPNATDDLGQKTGIYFNDVPAFLLANYKSIADIRENFTPENFRVVNNPAVYDVLYKLSPIAATRIDHFSLHDATGASAVIEYSTDENNNYVWSVIDTDGVLTNSPGYDIQVAYANEFQEQQSAQFGVNGLIMAPGFCGVGWDITTDTNNNCNSMGRFTVLTMLKKNVANTPFPDPLYLESPASNPNPAHKAIIFALRMLDWVKIPGHWPDLGTPGSAPANQIIGEQEMTICQFVKNHRTLMWYVKTAANEQWARFDLKKIFGVPSLEADSAEGDGSDKVEAQIAGGYGSHYRSGDRDYYGSYDRHDSYEKHDRHDSYDRRGPYEKHDRPSSDDWGYDVGHYHSPISRPIHVGVGTIMPPTRQWATDKTGELISSR